MAATQRLGFLDLPAEIRKIVYEYIFPDETKVVIKDGELQGDLDIWDKLNMILTCKLIKREAIPYVPRMTIHLIYEGNQGPDRAKIDLSLFPFVRCITFTGRRNYIELTADHTARWRYPRPMGGFTLPILCEYINLREVIVTGNWTLLKSLQPQGESVRELTAPDGPRNHWLAAYVLTKLQESPTPAQHPSRTVVAVPGQRLSRTSWKPYQANSAGTGARQFRITVICDIDLHDQLMNVFRIVSIFPPNWKHVLSIFFFSLGNSC